VVLDDWLAFFADDPAGWVGAGLTALTVLAVVVGAFWKWTKPAVFAVGRWLLRSVNFLLSLRVTTKDKIIRPVKVPLPVARWIVRPKQGGQDWEYLLGNTSPGSVAHDVQLEVHDDRLHLADGARWVEIPGEHAAPFLMRGDRFSFFTGVYFSVRWTDETGRRQRHDWEERLD
jgi:hypothetical protein